MRAGGEDAATPVADAQEHEPGLRRRETLPRVAAVCARWRRTCAVARAGDCAPPNDRSSVSVSVNAAAAKNGALQPLRSPVDA